MRKHRYNPADVVPVRRITVQVVREMRERCNGDKDLLSRACKRWRSSAVITAADAVYIAGHIVQQKPLPEHRAGVKASPERLRKEPGSSAGSGNSFWQAA